MELWNEVGKATGGRAGKEAAIMKSRRGFRYQIREASAMPSNTTVRDLPSDHRFTGVVLRCLAATRVGAVKE